MPSSPVKPPATLGQNIRKARERLSLSQLALARLMGHKDDPGRGGSSRVSKWESDQRIPTIETLQRIAEALGVPVGRLLARPVGRLLARPVGRLLARPVPAVNGNGNGNGNGGRK